MESALSRFVSTVLVFSVFRNMTKSTWPFNRGSFSPLNIMAIGWLEWHRGRYQPRAFIFHFHAFFFPSEKSAAKNVRVVICLWPVADLDAPTPVDQIFPNYMCFLVCIEWNLKRLGVSVYGKITINCAQNSATEFWECLGYMTPLTNCSWLCFVKSANFSQARSTKFLRAHWPNDLANPR